MSSKSYFLVSDFDDTIKISHTAKKISTVARGLFRSTAYLGMNELYCQMTLAAGYSEKEYGLKIISSSPTVLRKKIENFLRQHKFPRAEIQLRNWLRQRQIPAYKMHALEKTWQEQNKPLLLIGDDTEHDPQIFSDFQKKHPEAVLAIYIHCLRGKKLPEGQMPYYTAFDFACLEMAAGRLELTQVEKIGAAILTGKKKSRLIPHFGISPGKSFLPPLVSDLDPLFQLWKKISKLFKA